MAARSKPVDQAKPSGYTVLARRYRSREFDELIGQEPIALTLQNAIKTNRTAHAYLFCGTRGVGKTSMARIFARALNATDSLAEQGAIGDAILRGDDLDVIEIDGASYRGINDARELIAGAGLSPARSPYKVYIIDEVHQLTRDAFNALLKTMEEPPAHVKFILCTTEPHKVPATIQSRCQRFDFRAISTAKITQQLKLVLKHEGLSADDDVVSHVARLGNGSMRDALSLLDRLLAGGERTLTMDLLERMLGLPDHSLVIALVDSMSAGNAGEALERGAALLANGATVEQALDLLTEHLRTLMVMAACGPQTDVLDLSDESRATAERQAAHFDAPALVHMIAVCDAVSRHARTSAAARALFDAALVRLSLSHRFADIAGLLSGAPLPAPPAAPAAHSALSRAAAEVKPRPAADEQKKKLPLSAAEPAHATPLATFTDDESVADVAPPSPAGSESLAEVKPVSDDQLWPRVLDVASRNMGDRMRTEHLVFSSFDGRTLRLRVDESGADIARYLSGESERLVELVRRATGRTVRLGLDAGSQPSPRAGAEEAAQAQQARQLPLVQKALDLFDATVVAVQPRAAPSGEKGGSAALGVP